MPNFSIKGVVAVIAMLDKHYPSPIFRGWEYTDQKPHFFISKRINYEDFGKLVNEVQKEWHDASGLTAEGHIVIKRIHDDLDTEHKFDCGSVGPIGSTNREDAYFYARDRELINKIKGENAIQDSDSNQS